MQPDPSAGTPSYYITMSDPRTDQIARQAARLIGSGRAETIQEAIESALDSLNIHSTPLPSHALVRRHAGAMAMQAMGEAEYIAASQRIFEMIEQVMTLIEETLSPHDLLVVGRAARGQFDADPTVHIRAYTRDQLEELAEILVQFGFAEPSFESAKSRFGRLSRLRFIDQGVTIIITRCLPEMTASLELSLFTGNRLSILRLPQLRQMLARPGDNT